MHSISEFIQRMGEQTGRAWRAFTDPDPAPLYSNKSGKGGRSSSNGTATSRSSSASRSPRR